jgi:small subunit ribosomal protein S16
VHLPYYHIGVFDSRTRRDGRPVEQLGFYDPESDKEPVRMDLERARYWLSVGAKPSATVAALLKRLGVAPPRPAGRKAGSGESEPAAKKAPAKRKRGTRTGGTKKIRTANSKDRAAKKRQPAG